jgi:hypothetical protein
LPLAQPVAPVSVLQVVVQAAAPQTYGAQLLVVAVEQVPMVPPEQKAVGVKTLVVLLQLAGAQLTLVAACVHAPAPLQVPVLAQVVVIPQRAWGSATPLVTGAQVPLPLTLQAWQVPQAVVEQHTPSTQELPPAHSWDVPQLTPRVFWATQLPPELAVQ